MPRKENPPALGMEEWIIFLFSFSFFFVTPVNHTHALIIYKWRLFFNYACTTHVMGSIQEKKNTNDVKIGNILKHWSHEILISWNYTWKWAGIVDTCIFWLCQIELDEIQICVNMIKKLWPTFCGRNKWYFPKTYPFWLRKIELLLLLVGGLQAHLNFF